MNSIFTRTSIRRYTAQPVSEENIEKLLRAAMAAPSAGNQQPWEFYAVTDQEMIGKLAACSPYSRFLAEAPLVIVPVYRTVGLRFPDYAHIDLSAATENLLLEADALGLGAVWCGIAPLAERQQAVREALSMPDTLEAFALIGVGEPAETKKQQDRFDPARIHRI